MALGLVALGLSLLWLLLAFTLLLRLLLELLGLGMVMGLEPPMARWLARRLAWRLVGTPQSASWL